MVHPLEFLQRQQTAMMSAILDRLGKNNDNDDNDDGGGTRGNETDRTSVSDSHVTAATTNSTNNDNDRGETNDVTSSSTTLLGSVNNNDDHNKKSTTASSTNISSNSGRQRRKRPVITFFCRSSISQSFGGSSSSSSSLSSNGKGHQVQEESCCDDDEEHEVLMDLQDYQTVIELHHFLHFRNSHSRRINNNDDDDTNDSEDGSNNNSQGVEVEEKDFDFATDILPLITIDTTTHRIVGLEPHFFPRQLFVSNNQHHDQTRHQQQHYNKRSTNKLPLESLDLSLCDEWTTLPIELFQHYIDTTSLTCLVWNVSGLQQQSTNITTDDDDEDDGDGLELSSSSNPSSLQHLDFPLLTSLRLVGTTDSPLTVNNIRWSTTASANHQDDRRTTTLSSLSLLHMMMKNITTLETDLSNILQIPRDMWESSSNNKNNNGCCWSHTLRHVVIHQIIDTDSATMIMKNEDDEERQRFSPMLSPPRTSSSCYHYCDSSDDSDDGDEFWRSDSEDDDGDDKEKEHCGADDDAANLSCSLLLRQALKEQMEVRAYSVLSTQLRNVETLDIQLKSKEQQDYEEDYTNYFHGNTPMKGKRRPNLPEQQEEDRIQRIRHRRERRRRRRRIRRRNGGSKIVPSHRHRVPISLLSAGHMASTLKSFSVLGSSSTTRSTNNDDGSSANRRKIQYSTITADIDIQQTLRSFTILDTLRLTDCYLHISPLSCSNVLSSSTTALKPSACLRQLHLQNCQWDVLEESALSPSPSQQSLNFNGDGSASNSISSKGADDRTSLAPVEISESSWHTATDELVLCTAAIAAEGDDDDDGVTTKNIDSDSRPNNDDVSLSDESQCVDKSSANDDKTDCHQSHAVEDDDTRLSFLCRHVLKCCTGLEQVHIQQCGLDSFSKYLLLCLPEYKLCELTLDIAFHYSSSLNTSVTNTNTHTSNLWSIVDSFPNLKVLSGSYIDDLLDEAEAVRIHQHLRQRQHRTTAALSDEVTPVATNVDPLSERRNPLIAFLNHPLLKGLQGEKCTSSSEELQAPEDSSQEEMLKLLKHPPATSNLTDQVREHGDTNKQAILENVMKVAQEGVSHGSALIEPAISFVGQNMVDPFMMFVGKNGIDPVVSFCRQQGSLHIAG